MTAPAVGFPNAAFPSRKANLSRFVATLLVSLAAAGPLAAATALYVDDTFQITTDTGTAGLSAGDKVTFSPGDAAQVTNLTFGTNAFSDIGSAVAAASSGDTILVAKGTYTLAAAITVDKSVTLRGAQFGVDARPSASTPRVIGSASESVVNANGQSAAFIITASQVRIDGFDLKGATTAIVDTTGVSALTAVIISNNIIHNSSTAGGAKGIRLSAVDSALVERNNLFAVADSGVELGNSAAGIPTNSIVRFNEVHDLGSGGTSNSAIYIFATTGPALNALIKGNLVYNHFGNDGIKLGVKSGGDRNVSGGTIEDNIVHDVAQDGITIETQDTTVQRNEVYHSFSSNGVIYVEHGAQNVTIQNNSLHDNSSGLAAVLIGFSGRPASPTGMVVRFNQLTSNTNNFIFFRDNTGGTATCDASANWYGSSAQSAVSATVKSTAGSTATTNRVDFTPWLVSGTDTDSAVGFQPSFSSLAVAPSTVSLQAGTTGRIDEAVGLLAIGGTANLEAGSYVEAAAVNRAVTVNLPATASVTGNVTLSSGGTLTGTGTVSGSVTATQGTVAPGTAGPGILQVSSASLATTSTLAVDLDGTTVGTGYDQLNSTGTAALGGATLSLSTATPPSVGSTFNIVHGSSITGTFKNLAEGGVAVVGQRALSVHYSTTDVTLTVVPYNLAPTIDSVGNVSLFKSAGQQTVNLTGITAGQGESQTLTVTAVSSNPTLIANPSVTYQSPNATGSLSFAPTPGVFGSADITVTVTDNGGTANGGTNTKAITFTVVVLDRNLAPTIDTIGNVTVPKAAGEQTVGLAGISAGANESQTLTVSAVSDNPTLIPNPTISYQSPNGTGSLKFTPQIGQIGSATITVTVSDDGGTANGGVDTTTFLFTITVADRNIAPTFVVGPDESTAQDGGAQSIPNWATAINAGSPDESGQALNFLVEVDKPELFTAGPAISADGTLTYTPVPTASDTATVTVRLHDDGGTANSGADTSAPQSFTIAVTTYDEEQGTYNGLVQADTGVTPSHANCGVVRVVHGKKGAFTGMIKMGGKAFPLKGAFDKGGVARFGKAPNTTTNLVLKRNGFPDRLLALQLDVGGGSDQLTGRVTESGIVPASFAKMEADRALYTAKKNPVLPLRSVPVALLGKYTVVFAAKASGAQGRPAEEYPQGHGVGLLTVSASGVAKLVGTLADGTSVTCSNALSKNNRWPFYALLAKGAGSISGPAMFEDTANVSDLDALGVNWFKPAGPSTAKFYPAGWPTGIKADLLGSKLVVPPSKDKVSVFPDLSPESSTGNAQATFADGNLASALPKALNISGANKVTVVAPSTDLLSLSIRASAGSLSAAFVHPVSGKKVKARGVILQKQKRAFGYFSGVSEIGSLTIDRTP